MCGTGDSLWFIVIEYQRSSVSSWYQGDVYKKMRGVFASVVMSG